MASRGHRVERPAVKVEERPIAGMLLAVQSGRWPTDASEFDMPRGSTAQHCPTVVAGTSRIPREKASSRSAHRVAELTYFDATPLAQLAQKQDSDASRCASRVPGMTNSPGKSCAHDTSTRAYVVSKTRALEPSVAVCADDVMNGMVELMPSVLA